jgi:hypothetical protein
VAANENGDEGFDFAGALPAGFGDLLRDGIDLHLHGHPDLARAFEFRGSDEAVARLAHAYGLRGWVLKSHLWPTMDRAGLLNERLADIDFHVYGSITLNPTNGGVSGAIVELAAAHEAKVVFFPTWGFHADVERGGYIAKRMSQIAPAFSAYAAANALQVIDGNGRLTGAAVETLDACRDFGVRAATGHASLAESRAIAEYCADAKQPLLLVHPLDYVETPQQLQEFVDLGAFVEFTNAPLLHPDGHMTIRQVHEAIQTIGPDQVVLTTDVFSRWVPPEPECLRMFVEQLAYLGTSADDIQRMLAANPRRFLGLE